MRKFLLILLFVLTTFSLVGCVPSDIYSYEKHLKLITEKVEQRYMGEGSQYTSFKLYDVYNENEELEYVLVEFEPSGYVIVKIEKETIIFRTSYGFYTRYDGNPWCKFIWENNPDNLEVIQYNVYKQGVGEYIANYNIIKKYEFNEDGSLKVYNESPYKAANVLNEKLYLLRVKIESGTEYIMAVRKDDKFLNLVSMLEFELQDKYGEYDLSYYDVSFLYGFYL